MGTEQLKIQGKARELFEMKKYEDEMTDSIKGSKGRQCDKVQSGDGKNKQ